MTNMTNITNVNTNNYNYKLSVVYRLDFMLKLKEKGHNVIFSKPNPRKPWLQCWYFVETESFLTDLNELMEGSKNG